MKSRSLEVRRAMLHAALGAAVAALFTGVVPAGAQVPAMPKSPVTINIVDVAGNLALTQDAIDQYAKKHPDARREDQLHQGAGAGAARASSRRCRARAAATSTWC